MIVSIIGLLCLAILFFCIGLMAIVSSGYARDIENPQENNKVGYLEAYFIIPAARHLLLWIERRGRSP